MQPRYISSVLVGRRYKPNVRGNASRFEILRTNGTLSPFALVPTIRAETGRAVRHALSLGNAGWAWIGSRGVFARKSDESRANRSISQDLLTKLDKSNS